MIRCQFCHSIIWGQRPTSVNRTKPGPSFQL